MRSADNKRAHDDGFLDMIRRLPGQEVILPYVPEDKIDEVASWVSRELRKKIAAGKLEPKKNYVPRTFKLATSLAMLTLFFYGSAFASPIDKQIDGIVKTIIAAESSGRPWVTGDGGKARGLMQIQRATWERYTDAPWSRAYEPALNKSVGTKIVRDIARRYGARATAARIIFTYNTGKWAKDEHLPSWTRRHPNNVYRSVFTKGVIQ